MGKLNRETTFRGKYNTRKIIEKYFISNLIDINIRNIYYKLISSYK